MIVKEEDVVSRLGHVSLDILSTPRLIQLLEAAAVDAILPYLSSREMTVGTYMKVRHLAPTPIGMEVTAHALLREVDGRRLFFIVDAYDRTEKVAEGEHERLVVAKDQFFERVERKKGKWSRSP